jgi:hypothetical protein
MEWVLPVPVGPSTRTFTPARREGSMSGREGSRTVPVGLCDVDSAGCGVEVTRVVDILEIPQMDGKFTLDELWGKMVH